MSLKDQDYLDGLKNADNGLLQRFYDHFLPPIVRFVESNSGGRDDALDIFQEAVMVIYRKVRQEDFKLKAALSTYIYAICKNLWFKRISKKSFSEVSISGEEGYMSGDDFIQEIENQEKYRLFKSKLSLLGDGCKKILEMFFAGMSMEKITETNGLSSVGYAKKKKFKCKEQLVNLIKQDARYVELMEI